mgnify:CR=1 FL=1
MPPSEEAGEGQVETGAGIRRSVSGQVEDMVRRDRSGSVLTPSSRSTSPLRPMHLAISFSVSRKTGLSGGELVSWLPLSMLGVVTYSQNHWWHTVIIGHQLFPEISKIKFSIAFWASLGPYKMENVQKLRPYLKEILSANGLKHTSEAVDFTISNSKSSILRLRFSSLKLS